MLETLHRLERDDLVGMASYLGAPDSELAALDTPERAVAQVLQLMGTHASAAWEARHTRSRSAPPPDLSTPQQVETAALLELLHRLYSKPRVRLHRNGLMVAPEQALRDVHQAVSERVVAETVPLLRLGVLMASADGSLAPQERDLLQDAISTVQLTEECKATLAGYVPTRPLRSVREECRQLLPELRRVAGHEEIARAWLAFAGAVAMADEVLQPEESVLFAELAEALGRTPAEASQLLAEVRRPTTSILWGRAEAAQTATAVPRALAAARIGGIHPFLANRGARQALAVLMERGASFARYPYEVDRREADGSDSWARVPLTIGCALVLGRLMGAQGYGRMLPVVLYLALRQAG